MKTKRNGSSTKAFEKAVAAPSSDRCLLRLYVAGATARSRLAILRARQLCETGFNGNCELEVVDVYQQPILARDGQIVATPTLVKELPLPVRRIIGDLTNARGLFVGLDLMVKPKPKR
jgi:circadian clock protein KaiB